MPCSACPNTNVFAGGLCRGCYDRRRRRGTTERKNVSNLGACQYPGCPRQSFAKNLCSLHYQRARHPLNATWRNLRKRWPGEFPRAWKDFDKFVADVGERPYQNAQLRRTDHAKPWSKTNAVWQKPVGHSFKFDRRAYFRAWDLRKKYGITIEQVEQMAKDQGGLCACCPIELAKAKKVCVDHDHVTRRVRGLLCDQCNKGLGHFSDDSARLRRAADYLDFNAAREAENGNSSGIHAQGSKGLGEVG